MISPIAKASAYPPVTHCTAENDAPVDSWMLGIAMFTIVTSTRSMKEAVITIASAIHLRRSDTVTGPVAAPEPESFCTTRSSSPFLISTWTTLGSM